MKQKTIILSFFACLLWAQFSFAQTSEENPDGFKYFPKTGEILFVPEFKDAKLPQTYCDKTQLIYKFSKNMWKNIHKQEFPNCKITVFISYSDKPYRQAIFDKTPNAEKYEISEALSLTAIQEGCSSAPGKSLEVTWTIKKKNQVCISETRINNTPQDQTGDDCDLYNYLADKETWISDTLESKMRN